MSLFCIGLLVGHQAWKRYENYAGLRERLSVLETEKRVVASENKSISKQIEWYGNPAHLEEKAKKELNLKREGEGVIVIVDDGVVATTTPSSSKNSKDKRSWWDFLGSFY